jgi:hypothetical protein
MDGVGGWSEIYFSFTPVDDDNHLWLITSHVEVTGKDAEAYRAKRAEYDRKFAAAPPVMDVVRDIWSGKVRFADITHPDLAIVQDIAVQAGQGRIEDRASERLGRSDAGIILAQNSHTRTACARGRPSGKKMENTSGRGGAHFGILAAYALAERDVELEHVLPGAFQLKLGAWSAMHENLRDPCRAAAPCSTDLPWA